MRDTITFRCGTRELWETRCPLRGHEILLSANIDTNDGPDKLQDGREGLRGRGSEGR